MVSSHPTSDINDFEKKEKTWEGFKYGLEQIGLNIDEVRKRMKKGKTPWIDEKGQRKDNYQHSKELVEVQGTPIQGSFHSGIQSKNNTSKVEVKETR